MKNYLGAKQPSKEEQKFASDAVAELNDLLEGMYDIAPEVKIAETDEAIRVPLKALKLLSAIVEAMAEGKAVSVIPIDAELTTQAAAEYLNCSRPYVIKLLDEGRIPFSKVGKHRRVKYKDLVAHKKAQQKITKEALNELIRLDQEDGLYDI